MSFSFANRPASPFVRYRMRRSAAENKITDNPYEPPQTLRLYPLAQGQSISRPGHKNARPVNPLTHPMPAQNPMSRPYPLTGAQRTHAAPMIPQGHNPAHTMPHQGHSPAHIMPHQGHNPAHTMPHQGHNPAHTMPHQGHNPAHTMPQKTAKPTGQAATPLPPEKAAEHFRRVNSGLPDGVVYEPLDEQTMRMLKDNGHLPSPQKPSPGNAKEAPIMGQTNIQAPNTPHQDTLKQGSAQAKPMDMPAQDPVSAKPTQGPAPAKEESALTPAQSPKTNPGPDTPMLEPALIEDFKRLIQDERNAKVFYSHLAKEAPRREASVILSGITRDCNVRMGQYAHLMTRFFNNQFVPEETEINTSLDFKDAINLAISEESKALDALAAILDKAMDTDAEKIIQRIINKKMLSHHQLMALRSIT